MSRFFLEWTISNEDEGKTIKEFLKEHDISRAALTDIKFNGGKITIGDEEVNVRYSLKFHDALKVEFPEEVPSAGVQGERIPLDILYEDDYVLVVNKPAGMSTIPSREHPTGSLANALVGYYQEIGLTSTSHIITRLDRDTSGIVLVAKHRHVHHLLSEQQKNGLLKRNYEAFAEGVFKVKKGTIDKPIGRKVTSIIEREVNQDGQHAITHFLVRASYKYFSHVYLSLETGRTHQIRVHLSYLGHPLLGDDLYGGSLSLIKRQALHCCKISFYHPFLNKTLQFNACLPEDMHKLIQN